MTLDPAVLMPSLMALHGDAEKLGWQLHQILFQLERIAENTTPPADPVYDNARSNGLANTLVVSSGACKLFGFSGVNTNAAAQFILGFDLSRNAAPVNGTVPDFVTKAPASDNFWMSWAPNWRQQRLGLVLCNSSTANTLTIGAADCTFDAQWVPA